MLHDAKTVIGNDFDQETEEKKNPAFILLLDLANVLVWENVVRCPSRRSVCLSMGLYGVMGPREKTYSATVSQFSKDFFPDFRLCFTLLLKIQLCF